MQLKTLLKRYGRDGRRRNKYKVTKCMYCNVNEPNSIDHIVPKSSGGRNEIENYALVCMECNRLKACQSITNFLSIEQIQYVNKHRKRANFCSIEELVSKYDTELQQAGHIHKLLLQKKLLVEIGIVE